MSRTRAERRHNDWTKAIRKRKKDAAKFEVPWYNNLHQFSKNKIHNTSKTKHLYKRDRRNPKKYSYMIDEIKEYNTKIA